jgi:hypothetical protein
MMTGLQASMKEGLRDDRPARQMSCLQASLQDGKSDGIQAGRHAGWHCIHCE